MKTESRLLLTFYIYLISFQGVLLFTGCRVTGKTITRPIEDTFAVTNDTVSLPIFDKSNSEMVADIRKILSQEAELYPKLMNQPIMFTLYCDTLNGKILNITTDDLEDFQIYKTCLTDYFFSFSAIQCATYPITGKISEYWLIVWLSPKELTFHVYSGYADE
jgi:hypothetical protein